MELAEAMSALSGPKRAAAEPLVSSPPPRSPSAALPGREGWFVPPHLLRLPAVRAAAFAAHDLSREAATSQTDFEKIYKYGLSLQELASKLSQQPADQLLLLHQAAEVYMEACRLRHGRHAAALYNWAVALTDIARLVRAQQPEEAYECLTAAAHKYAQSLAANPDNPQANNNWGLVLQDLSSLRPATERARYLHHSLQKFRRAIRLRPDFDRACYNLGTVLYSHACSLQDALLASQEASEAAAAAAAAPLAWGSSGGGRAATAAAAAADHAAIQAAFSHAAMYIALAYAMQPGKQVYWDSLSAVQRLLPLPHLRAGALLAAHPATARTPAERWVACWFGVDHARLAAVRPPSAALAGALGMAATPLPLAWDLADIADARLCCDPSLPPGAAIWLGLRSDPRGVFLVAADQDDAEGWVDALLLLSSLLCSAGTDSVKAALTVRR